VSARARGRGGRRLPPRSWGAGGRGVRTSSTGQV